VNEKLRNSIIRGHLNNVGLLLHARRVARNDGGFASSQ
jgi:hypothetical protein